MLALTVVATLAVAAPPAPASTPAPAAAHTVVASPASTPSPAVAAPPTPVTTPATTPATTPTERPSFAIRADSVWLGDGRTLEKALVVVENGKIARVDAKSESAGDLEVIEHHGTLSAGLIALRTQLGLGSEASDDARLALADAVVGVAFAPHARDFELARGAGVTSVVLVPRSPGICSGVSAVVKTAGRAILTTRAHLVLGIGGEALGFNTEPTSFSGQMALLDELFAKHEGAVEAAKGGAVPCYLMVSSRSDCVRAIAFAKKHKLGGALVGAALAGEIADEIKSSKLSVVLPVLDPGIARRELKSALDLAQQGVPFGFAGDAPDASLSLLRASAAMLVREGLDAQTAWSALTSEAARIARVGERVGRIAKGYDADLVLWSGNPLDLRSEIKAVYVEGERVVGGER